MEPNSKRVKRLFKDPNPLFTKWLTEWKEEAEKNDTRMKYSYRTALKSLRQYPLPLTSGGSCNILKGFGTAICAKLDKRLQQYIDAHGPLAAPADVRDRVELGGAAPRRKPARKPAAADYEQPQTDSSAPQRPSGDDASASKKGRRSGEYLPRPGSGNYAILVTLRRQEQQPHHAGSMSKSALQEAAQPLCSSSFTLPERGSYYTAWSSSAALVKRNLLLRQGNPARFSLTPEGRLLADRLLAATAAAPSQQACFDRLQAASPSPDRLQAASISPDRLQASSQSPSKVQLSSEPLDRPQGAVANGGATNLQYEYVSSDGAAVTEKEQAAVLIEEDFVGFLVRCRRAELCGAGVRYRPDIKRPDCNGLAQVYLDDLACAETCPAYPLAAASSAHARKGVAAKPVRKPTASAAASGRRLHDMSSSDSDIDWDGLELPSDAVELRRPAASPAHAPVAPAGTSRATVPTASGDQELKRPRAGFVLNVAPPSPSPPSSPQCSPPPSPPHLSSPPLQAPSCSQYKDPPVVGSPVSSPKWSSAQSSAADPIVLSSDEGDDETTPPRPATLTETGSLSEEDGAAQHTTGACNQRTDYQTSSRGPSFEGSLKTGAFSTTATAAGGASANRARATSATDHLTKHALVRNGSVPASSAEAASSAPPCPVRPVQQGARASPDWEAAAGGAEAPEAVEGDDVPALVLLPGTFDVMLCVDNQETSGKKTDECYRSSRDVILNELQKNGVAADVRKLSVGDFLWVARPRTGRQPEELVLPYVVERKRLDDLAQSIRGTRYHEQKHRLSRCGLPHVIYLAEALGTGPRAQHLGLPAATLKQALINTHVVDGFMVKRTADQRETAAFLTLMTRRLQRQYQGCRLRSCPRERLSSAPPPGTTVTSLLTFSDFHRFSAKRQKLTATDVFARMLLQMSGMSADRVAAVVARYPTVQALVRAYAGCSVAEGEALLAPLRTEASGRRLGATLSRVIYHLYCDDELA